MDQVQQPPWGARPGNQRAEIPQGLTPDAHHQERLPEQETTEEVVDLLLVETSCTAETSL